jgi:hypothetical protein
VIEPRDDHAELIRRKELDPADTRALIAATLTAAENAPHATRPRFVDTW